MNDEHDRIVHLMHPNGARTVCGQVLAVKPNNLMGLTLTLAQRTTCKRCRKYRLWYHAARRPIETDETEHGEYAHG